MSSGTMQQPVADESRPTATDPQPKKVCPRLSEGWEN